MSRLFIAEKPELARAIACGLSGEYIKTSSYIKKGSDIITWAYGHILKLADPHDYNLKYEKWNLADLPFQIDEFKYVPIEKSANQLKIICDLINKNDIDEIIHCGDADDEGQILVDEILDYAKNHKPVSRLLINDNTEKGIKDALAKIQPNSKFKGLSQRGFARSRADWIVGLNLTRAYTIMARRTAGFGEVLSLGRVQTPILSMIVNRDNEHENFKSIFYYAINGKFNIGNYLIQTNLKTDEKITNENIANSIKSECESNQPIIDFIKTEHKSENPPLPYSLLKLQVDCSKILGLKPDETLKITQDLREKCKAITYNRSDCEYLPTTLWESASATIDKLRSNFKSDASISEFLSATNSNIKSIAFNDENITAHHAIIPTAQNVDLSILSKDELNVYILIVKRFLAQFFDKIEFDSTNIQIAINDNKFIASQINITKHTFDTFLKGENIKEKDEEEISNDVDFRLLNQGDNTLLKHIEISKKKTNPKPYYTMATLLKDLTGVAKYAKDEKIKKLLFEKDRGKKGENGGIGTPATRSTHIKNLIDKGYIEISNDKKQIVKSTKKGKDLVAIAPEILTCVDMTALWFEKQKMIENSDLSLNDFLMEINKQIKDEIEKIKDRDMGNFGARPKDTITCPTCQKGYLIRYESKNKKGTFYWGCSGYSSGCKAIFYDNNGKPAFEAKPKQEVPNDTQICPKCKIGKLLSKTSAKGFSYFACNGKLKNGNWCDAKFKINNNGKLEEMIFKK